MGANVNQTRRQRASLPRADDHDLAGPTTSPSALAAMALNGNEDQQRLAASHPNTPPQIQHRLATKDVSLALLVAKNPTASPATLIWIEKHHPVFADTVLDNVSCPIELLNKYADSGDVTFRQKVARNMNSDAHVLEKLAVDSAKDVRSLAYVNRNCPEHSRNAAALMGIDKPARF